MLLEYISIHAPRVGSDFKGALTENYVLHFNPRSPCGERRTALFITLTYDDISIHAPRVGSDNDLWLGTFDTFDFNPRSPCGERLR